MRSRVPAIWFLRLSGWEHLEGGGGGEEGGEEEERGGLFKVGFLRDIFPVFGDCLCFDLLVRGGKGWVCLFIRKREGWLLEH